MGNCCITQGVQPGTLWHPRRGGLVEREVQEGADIRIPMADSCCCVAETNTTL